MPDPCDDVISDVCPCPEAELGSADNNTVCEGITLGHPEVTLPHDPVPHIDPFFAVKYRYRTA